MKLYQWSGLCLDCDLPHKDCVCNIDDQGIAFFHDRCETHPDHQNGMVTYAMVEARLREEIAELRAALRKARIKQ